MIRNTIIFTGLLLSLSASAQGFGPKCKAAAAFLNRNSETVARALAATSADEIMELKGTYIEERMNTLTAKLKELDSLQSMFDYVKLLSAKQKLILEKLDAIVTGDAHDKDSGLDREQISLIDKLRDHTLKIKSTIDNKLPLMAEKLETTSYILTGQKNEIASLRSANPLSASRFRMLMDDLKGHVDFLKRARNEVVCANLEKNITTDLKALMMTVE